MNRIFKILGFALLLDCSIALGGLARSMDPAQRPVLNQQVSVHDMFKDLTEDEIVMLMEEGQQYIKYMEEQASPEEQMAFAKMMEETLKNFSEEDFAEIEKIVKVVEPILAEKESEPVKAEPIKEEPVKKAETVVMSGDSSLEYTLHRIHKTINGILLKAKSDLKLNDMLNKWATKDDFNEMVRLIQVLNKKDLIAKLTAGKTEDVKKLFDTIENFAKRLEIENKQFTVADTFGLEVDEKTSAENVKKFNKILEFLAGATQTLLPMIVKFVQDYEPEALKIAKALDAQAKSSLDAAKQIEKMKKAPVDRPYAGRDNVPYNGSYNQQGGYTPSGANYGNDGMSARERNKMNAMGDQGQGQKPVAGPTTGGAEKVKSEADKQKEKEAADKKAKDEASLKNFNDVITKIEQYDDRFDNNAFMDYSTALNKAGKMYDAFGKPLDLSKSDADIITDPEMMGPLTKEQTALKSQYQAKLDQFNSGKNIETAETHYAELKEAIDNIKGQINEIKTIADTTRNSLNNLSLDELIKLQNSPALKKLNVRFQSYESSFKSVQKELKDKHEKHMLEFAKDTKVAAYNALKSKAENLHGLDKTISDTRSSLDLLKRSIQGDINRKKRDANKR